MQLALTVNVLSAALALAGLLGYVFVYTVWLKPLTPQNIVIGGAAGAVPPLVGWAAATGGLALEALYPFGIVFLWTPPHFWALSLLIKDDYARTGVPMLPVVKGEAATRRQILAYTLVLVAFTLLPVATGFLGALYAACAARARAPASRSSRCACCGAPTRAGGAAPLPLLARLPGAAVLRDGRGPGGLIETPPVDRTRAASTLGSGLVDGLDRARRLRPRASSSRSSTSADHGRDERRNARAGRARLPAGAVLAAGADRLRPRRRARLAVHLVALRRRSARVVALFALCAWIRDARAGFNRLPRKQRDRDGGDPRGAAAARAATSSAR